MSRSLPLLLIVGAISFPALCAEAIDPAAVTCKDYNTATHQGMMDIGATMRASLKNDPKLGSLSEIAMIAALNKACEAHPDSKVVDALHS